MKVVLKHRSVLKVGLEYTVPGISDRFPYFTDMPTVFATAMMVAFVEQTCIEALQPYLLSGQKSVGIHVNLSHIAATPEGIQVQADVELVEIKGKKLRFQVECRDEKDVICAGFHERYIIDENAFMERLSEKFGRN
jgi:fluoroacetyl-CoA thioesterase